MVRRHLLWVPIAAAVIATALFAVQGGFGGGHGHLDRVIWALGLPGVLFTAWAPGPVSGSDLLRLVWWPALWNALLWAGIARIASLLRRQPVSPPTAQVPSAHAGAYLHPDGFILHAQHRATSGVLLGAPPVLRLPLDVSATELGLALLTVLRAYAEGVPHPTDWGESGRAFLKAAGYRSWKSLEAPARCCWIESADGRIVITPLRNGGSRGDKKGFQPFGAEPVIVSVTGNDDEEEAGNGLKAAFDRAE